MTTEAIAQSDSQTQAIDVTDADIRLLDQISEQLEADEHFFKGAELRRFKNRIAATTAKPTPPLQDAKDAEMLDWIAVNGSFGLDSATGEVGGNGQTRKAATRKNIIAAIASQKGAV